MADRERQFLHDLKNSLAVASGQNQMLQRSLSKAEQSPDRGALLDRAEKVAAALERLATLIKSRQLEVLALKDAG